MYLLDLAEDVLVSLFPFVAAVEGRTAAEQNEEDDPERPDVTGLA